MDTLRARHRMLPSATSTQAMSLPMAMTNVRPSFRHGAGELLPVSTAASHALAPVVASNATSLESPAIALPSRTMTEPANPPFFLALDTLDRHASLPDAASMQ